MLFRPGCSTGIRSPILALNRFADLAGMKDSQVPDGERDSVVNVWRIRVEAQLPEQTDSPDVIR